MKRSLHIAAALTLLLASAMPAVPAPPEDKPAPRSEMNVRAVSFRVMTNSVGLKPSFSIRTLWLLFFLSVRAKGAWPATFPSTMTVAPAGADVTGILCSALRVIVAQFEASRALASVSISKTQVAFCFTECLLHPSSL
jgi:hypothetical protein